MTRWSLNSAITFLCQTTNIRTHKTKDNKQITLLYIIAFYHTLLYLLTSILVFPFLVLCIDWEYLLNIIIGLSPLNICSYWMNSCKINFLNEGNLFCSSFGTWIANRRTRIHLCSSLSVIYSFVHIFLGESNGQFEFQKEPEEQSEQLCH